MANIERLLNGLSKSPSNVDEVMKSIFHKFPEYRISSSTPVPNQVFAPDLNDRRDPSTMYFSKKAFSKLKVITEFDYRCTAERESLGKADRPLEFTCYGYRDWDGDIYIDNIEIPLFEEYFPHKRTLTQKDVETIVRNNDVSSRDMHIEATSRAFDFLRNSTFTNAPVGDELVALIGTTKHYQKDNPEASNCFTLGEIADSIIPNVKAKSNIITGILAITPKTMEFKKPRGRKPFSTKDCFHQVDGSLECLIAYYTNRCEKSCYIRPYHLANIVSATGITSNGDMETIKVSQSKQPIDGLVRGMPLNRDSQENEMIR